MEVKNSRFVLGALFLVMEVTGAAAAGFLFPEGSPDPLEVSWQRVDVKIVDQVAVTRIRQTFRNHTDSVLEGEYRFTLSPGASVSDFAIWEGDQRVPGVIRRKEEAREIYQAIVSGGQDPGLLEQVAPTIFSAKVFPIPARGEKRIEIEYRELLPLDEGLCLARVPLLDDRLLSPRIGELVVTFEVKDGGRLVSAWSPESTLEIHHKDEHQVTASYEGRNVQPVQDILLHYQVVRPERGFHVESHRQGTEPGHFLLTLNPDDPGLPERQKDVVFVVDVSGSMKGERLLKAKQALKFCLTLLEAKDRFDLVRFSTDVVRMGPKGEALLTATDDEIDRAIGWVEELQARGGTNLEGGMREGLQILGSAPTDRPAYLVVLSDGDPTVGVTHFGEIGSSVERSNAARARIFTFGIGEVAGSRLLASLSEKHRGESLAIRQDEDLESRLPLFFGKLVRPLFDEVEIDWGGLPVEQVYPKKVPTFYLGRAVSLSGRYREPGKGPVKIHAKVEGRAVELTGEVDFPATATAGFIPRLWAQRHVAELLEMSPAGHVAPEVVDEIVRLSTEHVFVTPYTSFIAVPDHEKRRLPDDLRAKLEKDPREVEARIEDYERALTDDPEDAESHFQLALAYDESNREDAARKSFEHAKAAIRLDPSNRERMQGALRNSKVSRSIAQMVREMIVKTESETLTDEETQKYAEQIQNMLGEKLDVDDFRDKDKMKEILDARPQLKERFDLEKKSAGKKMQDLLDSSGRRNGLSSIRQPRVPAPPASVRGTSIEMRTAVKVPEPLRAEWTTEPAEESIPMPTGNPVPADDYRPRPPDADPTPGYADDLVDSNKRYVDKLSRITVDERDRLVFSVEKFTASTSGEPTEEQKRELVQTAIASAQEEAFHRRLGWLRAWIAGVERRGKELGELATVDLKLQKLFYTNKLRAVTQLTKVARTVAKLDGFPVPVTEPEVPVAGPEAASAVAATPTPDPGSASMDAAWRGLRAQVASVRSRVRSLRGRVDGMEKLIAGARPEELPPAVEAVRASPAIIQGGQLARLSLTLRHSGEAPPRIRWRCREGRFLESAEGAATWEAPRVPGAYTIEVVLYPAVGRPVRESFEVEVYQPGRISYSAELLDARVSLLNHSLKQLHEEYAQLEGRLDPARSLPEAAEFFAGLSTPAAKVASPDQAVTRIRHDPQGPYHWTSWLHRGE